MAAILKNRKMAKSPEWFNRSAQTLAKCRISALQTASAGKISKF